ncbi:MULTISPECIES: alpha/beta hydrolase [unclassified Streptomyces]|uniref:alpha/beta fold hydrolase n=1 Tax=unclassified Streptomyces TaxID=2593676 RepID=UPI0033CDA3D5
MSRPPTFVPPSCARSLRLATSRGEFAVLDARPSGAPRGTALLLPGYTGSKEDFIALLAPLTEAGFRAVAVDGRGQYETGGPADREEPYAQQELASDVLAQAAAVGPGLHLVGHSLGGQISRAAVLRDASPFASFTLMSSGPAEVSSAQQEKVELLAGALAVMSMDEVWTAMQTFEGSAPEDAAEGTNGDREDLRRRWLLHSPAQLLATGRQLRSEPDRTQELAAVGLALHVLSGDEDDTWPIGLLDDMALRLKAARTVVDGAGHSPNTDRPEETAQALVRFWEGC